MATSNHGSSSSSQSSIGFLHGQGFSLVLDHILNYPGSYEIPLRTMYTLNSTPRAQPSRPATPTTAGPMSGNVTSQFQTSLINQVSSLPQQQCLLPPSFITGFVRRCFPEQLHYVDFPQALTALDYLKDLETRRRREFKFSLERLGLTADILSDEPTAEAYWNEHPGVKQWFLRNYNSERKIASYYTHLYVALRRWILINELSLEPFSKHNCLAMLNTLYPPLPPSSRGDTAQQPTQMLTSDILKGQRDQFFKWIGKVEADGVDVMEPLMQQGRRPPYRDPFGNMKTDENGWPAVRDALDAYLRIANAVIDDCSSVRGFADFTEAGKKERKSTDEYTLNSGRESRSGRKADSGVSFNADGNTEQPKRSSNSSSIRDSRLTGYTVVNNDEDYPSPTELEPRFPPAKTKGSTMEKLAREVRKMRFGSKSRPTTPSPTYSTHETEERGRGRRKSTVDNDEAERPRSRAGTFIRSLSRARSRSRPRTATGGRDSRQDDVPPTPTIPASFMDYSDDEREGATTKLRRSFSQFRSRSRNNSAALRKMKSSDMFKATGRQNERVYSSTASEGEDFDVQQMRAARDRWEAENADTLHEDEAEAYGIGEAR